LNKTWFYEIKTPKHWFLNYSPIRKKDNLAKNKKSIGKKVGIRGDERLFKKETNR